MTLRCLVADDEPIARRIIESYIDKIDGLEVVAKASDGVEVLTHIQGGNIDLIFLDINMPNLNGIDVAKTIQTENGPSIIFTTAYPDYAVQGFEVEAQDYLVKPISFDRFYQSVQRLLKRRESDGQEIESIYIKADKRIHRVTLRDIFALEAYGDYVKVHCVDQMLLTKDRLSNLESKLQSPSFQRVHRSWVINLSAISYVEGNMIRIGELHIPVSEKHRAILKKLM